MPKHSRGYARVDRVKEQILRELAELIRTGLKDPRAASFITLNEVEVTRDYSHAKVYYTIFDADKREVTQEALEHAAGYLRSELAKRLTVFNTPQLHFLYDESIERGLHISNLIDKVAVEDQAAAAEHDDDAPEAEDEQV
ncbi:MAG: 30S ribosome-binding factor RbfA [Neisseriaceae bacterium]|nr:30S ribosome-binding factor RbfA [Neisseriaceae bacterium]